MEDTLLEVRDLQVEFSTKMGIVRVLDKVNLKFDHGARAHPAGPDRRR